MKLVCFSVYSLNLPLFELYHEMLKFVSYQDSLNEDKIIFLSFGIKQ